MITSPRFARRAAGTLVAALTATAALAVATVASGPSAPAAHGAPIPPPDKRVYFVADSVGLGARGALGAAFPPDWQVTADGTPALFVEQLESHHVRQRMATTPSVFGDYAVVAGGYNYPFWDPARFDRSIDSMLGALRSAGAKHIFWVTLREVKPQYITGAAWRQVQPYYWYFPTVNAHLRRAVERHPDLSLIDWAAIADRPGLTYDAIHLNTGGAAEYSANVARVVTSAANRLPEGTVTPIRVAGVGGVPAGAAAVAVNLTVTNPRAASYLTAFPCGGSPPLASNLNHRADQTVAAAAIVPVGADGSICVFTSSATHLIVDLTGWFPADSGFAATIPTRLADTRDAGTRQRAGIPLPVTVPTVGGSIPSAVALNVTAVDAPAAGFVTVAACGVPPGTTSNVNYQPLDPVPNLVVVAPDASGQVCVTASTDAHLIVDLFGSFAPGAAVEPLTPRRVVDSRSTGTRAGAGGVTVVDLRATGVVPPGASGALLNLTATGPASVGFLTAYPCAEGLPTASNLNTYPDRDTANLTIVRPDADGRVCVYTSGPSDVIVDLLGYTTAAFAGTTPTRLLDTRG